MRIDVHSRKQVAVLEPRKNVWVISINTPGDEAAPLQPGWESVHRFCFSDIAGDSVEMMLWVRELQEQGREVILFDMAMAREIRYIVQQAVRFNKDLIIHCDAGVSRSQAVARWARQVFNAEVVSHTIGTDHHANGLVLRHLMWLEWQETFANRGTFTTDHEDAWGNDE